MIKGERVALTDRWTFRTPHLHPQMHAGPGWNKYASLILPAVVQALSLASSHRRSPEDDRACNATDRSNRQAMPCMTPCPASLEFTRGKQTNTKTHVIIHHALNSLTAGHSPTPMDGSIAGVFNTGARTLVRTYSCICMHACTRPRSID
jgi:hypothetical protein